MAKTNMKRIWVFGILLAAGACSSSKDAPATQASKPSAAPVAIGPMGAPIQAKAPQGALARPAIANPSKVAFAKQSLGFPAFSSQEVRDAAMRYPSPKEALAEAPISLTADDGTGLALESLDAQAVVEGPLAFTELRMQFRNPQARTLEGRFQITLPEGASVSRLAMRMDDGWREAEVVERMAARRAYEDFLHRKQDPMLLEKEAGNQFRARIFPIPANGIKEVILSYSHELTKGQGYRLPLKGLPAVHQLAVRALVAQPSGPSIRYQPFVHQSKDTVPTHDFQVAMDSSIHALRHGANVVARFQPELQVEASRPTGLVLLFDTSASRAPGFSRQVQRLGSLVRAIAAGQGARLQLHVAAFDQEVSPIYEGAAGDFGSAQLAQLLARRPLGASDLAQALDWAGTQTGADRVLVVGDGVATAGDEEIAAHAKALPAAIQRIDMLLVGGIRDQNAAERMVRGTRALDGVVLADRLSDEEIARRLGDATTSVAIALQGAEWVWPNKVDGVQPGDEIVVYAGFPEGYDVPAQLNFQLEGGQNPAPIEAVATAGPLLERSGIHALIAKLEGQYQEEADKAEKAALKAEIVDLSVAHRVLSDHTALLVLERESDYARFDIDRTALTDILRVGSMGLELMQRKEISGLVIAKPRKEFSGEKKMSKGKASRDLAVPGGNLAATADDDDFDEEEMEDGNAEGAIASADPGEMADRGGPQPSGQFAMAAPPAPPAAMAREQRPSSVAAAPVARAGIAEERMESDSLMADEASSGGPADYGSRMAQSESPRRSRRARSRRRSPANERIATKQGPPALTGDMALIRAQIDAGHSEEAVAKALAWRNEESGNVMALIALGESLEAAKQTKLAARAYGSIIDLFPSRADLRRFAASRLLRLKEVGEPLSVDSLRKAAEQRPDHLSVHRLLAYALVRSGDLEGALTALETGLKQSYPSGRFRGGLRILREDMGIVAAVLLARGGLKIGVLEARLQQVGASLATGASTRFVLNWETDANDVDFHIYDAKGGHAYYSDKSLPSGGQLFEDVTTGYGPECFAIPGKASAYPYQLQIHYYSRGPMGYGMGQVEILQHDGKGELKFDTRPFVVMNDGAYLDLGKVAKPL